MDNTNKLSRIRVLDTYTAKQIAAGEIIERPACIVRELVDNSIDAGARAIEVLLQDGGLHSICVSDDGEGMSKEDLEVCCESHATSKIRIAQDLLSITSMGFRGEALASISAISRVTITSFDAQRGVAHSVTIENGKCSHAERASLNAGTQIYIEKIFHSIPVRKKFLSTGPAEKTRIKALVLEKAAAYPHKAFSLKDNGAIVVKLPCEDAFSRALRVVNHSDARMFMWHDTAQSDDKAYSMPKKFFRPVKLAMALGLPEIAAKSRKHIHIYVNKRPVKAFQIMQAIEYAYKDFIHGNVFPQAVMFITIPPEEIDVNIHPTKQEVRIKDIASVRSLIIQTITTVLQSRARIAPTYQAHHKPVPTISSDSLFSTTDTEKNSKKTPLPVKHIASTASYRSPYKESPLPKRNALSNAPSNTSSNASVLYEKTTKTPLAREVSFQTLQELSNTKGLSSHTNVQSYVFISCVFATYALFEKEEELLFLDFHATHERQIFDTLVTTPKPQVLAVPVPLVLFASQQQSTALIESCKSLGIHIEATHTESTSHVLTAVPAVLYKNIEAIVDLIQTIDVPQGLDAKLFAQKACKKAVKAGDHLDAKNAYALLSYALQLESPRCPHGRPLWAVVSKHSLDVMIGRA